MAVVHGLALIPWRSHGIGVSIGTLGSNEVKSERVSVAHRYFCPLTPSRQPALKVSDAHRLSQ